MHIVDIIMCTHARGLVCKPVFLSLPLVALRARGLSVGTLKGLT